MINEFIVTVISENQLQARAFDGTSNILINVNKSDSVTKIFEKLENGKSELSIENEKLQQENEKVANDNMELQEEINHLKSTIERLEEQYKEFVEEKQEYEVGKRYEAGDIFQYNGVAYTVIQKHVSQKDWEPDKTPALYKKTNSTTENTDAVLQEFAQPTGAHDSYKNGDKVIFNNKVYESTIDNNVWSPETYPQGWKDLGGLDDYKN